jgi:ABC-2 type transport system permease protein
VIRRVWAVARKELLELRRDTRSLAVLFFTPAFLLVMFGYAVSLDVKHVPLAVVDLDRTSESRAFVRAFTATEYFRDSGARPQAPREVDSLLASERARVALVIPRGYGRDLVGGERASVQVIVDAANASAGAAILGYVSGIAEAQALAASPRGALPDEAARPRIELRPRIYYNPELSSAVYLVPGLVTLIMMITGVVTTALTIVREKERGTMEQVLVSPLRPAELILGKTLPYMLVSLLSAGGVLTAGVLLFQVPVRGSLLSLLLVTVAFLAACLGLGLLISSLAATQQAAFLISIISTLLPSFVLSGFVFPIRNMPLPIQVLTFLMPSRYYLAAIRDILLKGASVAVWWDQALGLVLFSAAALALASARMRRRTL